MTRWEYREIDMMDDGRSTTDQLNEEGQNGWELIHLEFVRGTVFREPIAHAFFKRPRRNDAP